METDARRLFLRIVVVSLVSTGALAIGTLVLGDFGETEGRILLTTASISVYSLLCLPAGVLREQGRLATLAIANIAAALAGFALALNLIWIAWDDAGDFDWKSLVVATTVAGTLTQASAVESRRRDSDSTRTRRIAASSHVSVVLLATLVVAAVLGEIDDGGYYRALGAVAVANVLLVALPPVLRRMLAPAATTYPFVCRLQDGRAVEYDRPARDFAAAVERAIRELERDGGRVLTVERR